MGYRLVYDISKTWQTVLRNILLLISVFLDFVMIYNLVKAILISNIYWINFSFAIVISIFLRIIAIHLCSKIEYEIYNDIFTIKRHYILYTKNVLNCNTGDITSVQLSSSNSCELTHSKNYINISDSTSPLYYIKTKNKGNFICNIDEYMNASIMKGE